MNIAFLHYHLKTGGVTTVIKQQIQAISNSCDIIALSGEPADNDFPCRVVHIPGLAYDNKGGADFTPEAVAGSIKDALFSIWEKGVDILHVHNPTLAKNKNLIKILNILQSMGIRLFLQIHDFAEDGRPDAYFQDPYVKNCHYGVINSRDYTILQSAGLKPKGLHQIFNTITPLNIKTRVAPLPDTIVYPVRAIRRKNIGEAILVSLFADPAKRLVITLPPNSPKDIKAYTDWKVFAASHHLNVGFDAGLKQPFERIIGKSAYVITTSINEGFGFSFLEAWTAGKCLWGRILPDICTDFIDKGIQLNHLYESLSVPLDWIGKDRFYRKWRRCLFKTCHDFNLTPDSDCVDQAFDTLTHNNRIDFGMLDETFQKQVLLKLFSEDRAKQLLLDINPFLNGPDQLKDNHDFIGRNQKAVLSGYNKTVYKNRLLSLYKKVVKKSVNHKIDKGKLLQAFLNPLHFCLLKFSDYES